jgi:hypothetical protein
MYSKNVMGIERSKRPLAASRIARAARQLLDTSTLCAIATVAPRDRAHISTAYFAWTPKLEIVWLSEPRANHSRNVRANDSVAITVYDSTQHWDALTAASSSSGPRERSNAP